MRARVENLLSSLQRVLAYDATAELAAGSAMVFAPHPDDEVLGCGGTLALKAANHQNVHIVVMTDGRTSHAGRMPSDLLVETRRSESLEAVGRLGLEGGSCSFLDFPDSQLVKHRDAAERAVAELILRHAPGHVFAPSRRDGLTDHVVTFEVVMAAAKRTGGVTALYEYPVWLWETWPWSGRRLEAKRKLRALASAGLDSFELASQFRARVCIAEVLPRKLQALACYRSQMQRPQDDPAWPILADVDEGRFLRRFTAEHEIFRRSMLRQ